MGHPRGGRAYLSVQTVMGTESWNR